jgi:hypothetical protein
MKNNLIQKEEINMQTEYKMYHDGELLGQIGDASIRQIDSYVAEANIAFGIALKRGTKGDAQCLPLDGLTDFLGIAIRDEICTSGVYPKGRVVSVMTKGRVVIRTTEAVKAGDKAYIHADGSFNKTLTDGLEIGVFHTSQESDNELVTLEIK